jgi:prepilin signal peptidase PulO-like enzyme (type II secretory pathway)
MSGTVTAALAALAFALAGWAGTVAADALCTRRTPYADGPAPVAFVRAPFAAIGGGIGFALAAHGETPVHLAVLLVVMLGLAGCSAADLRCGALPDVLTLGPLALVVGLAAATRDGTPVAGAAFVAVPFACAAFASRGRGMGWGDVKLAALGGALLGGPGATLAFMLAALAAYIIARRTVGVRRPIAFGPYLAASIAVMLPLVRTF